jgi:hypothetical protein
VPALRNARLTLWEPLRLAEKVSRSFNGDLSLFVDSDSSLQARVVVRCRS